MTAYPRPPRTILIYFTALFLPLLTGCGGDEMTWDHELYADQLPHLSVPGYTELPKDEEMWIGHDVLLGGTPAVHVVSQHGFWTRITTKRGITAYVPSKAVRERSK